MSEHILDELSWRGLVAQSTDLDALRTDLDAGPLTLYGGFDPTADSLHAGNLVQLLTLARFQRAGHRPIVLAGGATGQIGDPRDVGERTLVGLDVIQERLQRIGVQLEKFVTFDDSPTGAVIENNLNWFAEVSALDFLRDVGKHFSVNVMLARETVKRRLASDGMSYTEFSYLLLQSYDYLRLHRKYGTKLQIGGSDQWGNIIGGVDYIRKVDGATVHALTTPLVTDSEGRKFGKSTGGGNLWLDPSMTSPYAWFQYFVNVGDAEAVPYLKMFTFLGREEIAELEQLTADKPQLRAAQRKLAEELTTLVHGAEQTRQVALASQALFGRGELSELDESTLDAVMAEVPTAEVRLSDEPAIIDLLLAPGLVDSKGAARRAVKEGGAYVNNVKVADEEWRPSAADALHGKWLVVRRGKRTTGGVRLLR
ncbi:tyrosine--tRNA ligase [Amycolatopsis acidiphila]|uniref:Tyrosine--tRNA ligase n=1 Tax=Amycolatopsis acidiphila TaxID=715473 RepID=A0A557ZVN7_9PSEU|nr:tyrosine--tRNA ligase [Amycolatopsis acidiphila]TVT16065.1 tyrosine--tRNA ligase [Amycolatopsis acidiphila]UIJ62279.1 tyrosine--tRNA ligase [Amycolatopsis acidiphila]GHG93091.1 tyrosine--tRNA ligase [Amycolatopsis acidiphila]